MMEKTSTKTAKIVVIGGGTGTSTLASGLLRAGVNVSIIVSMADDGGSTGILRRELGVLPPGDVRQCLISLAQGDDEMRNLLAYRFQEGSLKGHNFGNLLLAALEKTTGSFEQAVERVSAMLDVQGDVIPVTLDNVSLHTYLTTGEILKGESKLHDANLQDLDHLELSPQATPNPNAIEALESADLIVIAPGAFYSSTLPPLLVTGITDAIVRSNAKSVYVCNLVNKDLHNKDWSVSDYTSAIESQLHDTLDHVIYNTDIPDEETLGTYARDGESIVTFDPPTMETPKFIGADLLEIVKPANASADLLVRSTIRHNPSATAQIIQKL